MWFKNLCLYRLTAALDFDPEQLDPLLHDRAFRPAGKLEAASTGWVPPLGVEDAPLSHVANGYVMVCARREERILPAAAVREVLEARIAEIESKAGRPVRGKARADLRDEVILEMLPRAFTRSRRTFAYLDPRTGWLVVDAASPKRAEELTGLLRESVGSLPIAPVAVAAAPAEIMTGWVRTGEMPAGFSLGDECDLHAPAEPGGVVRVRRHDLDVAEIRAHLDAGKRVTRLALEFDERLGFVVDQNLAVKRLRFRDLVQDEAAGVDARTDTERFDADFAIMTLELARFLPMLVAAFGGEAAEENARNAA